MCGSYITLILVSKGPFTEFYQIKLGFKRHQTIVATGEMCGRTSPMQIKSLPCMKALTMLIIVDNNHLPPTVLTKRSCCSTCTFGFGTCQ